MLDGCGANLSKYILLITNGLVWVVSFILIFIGMLVIVRTDEYSYLFDGNENTLATAAGIILGTGCFLFLIGFCACVGALKEIVCLLQLYFVLITVIIILEITSAIMAFVYRDGLNKVITDTMNKAIVDEYDGEDNPVTKTIDLLQKEFSCCGTTGYTEWATSEWAKNRQNVNAIAPTSCCKRPKDDNCNTNVDNLNTEGCIEAFTSWFNDHYLLVGGLCLGLLVFEIMALIFTCCLLTTVKKENKVV